jgi:hypothetical protein
LEEVSPLYNDPKVIFHAIGPKVWSKLEGIDPSMTTYVMNRLLGEFVAITPDLSEEIISRIQRMQKTLLAAQEHYLSCIYLVGTDHLENVGPIASQLSQEVEKLFQDPLHPSLLFIGGHYYSSESRSIVGHTATYEVIRQDNGTLSFIVNNTIPIDAYHKVEEDRIYQLVYTDLSPNDLDTTFWKTVIHTNYMHPKSQPLMDAFYNYLNAKFKHKTTGRSYKRQIGGVCAWKSLSIWLRTHLDLPTYLRFKKMMFETFLAHFHPLPDDPTSLYLQAELTRKIDRINHKLSSLNLP